MTSIGSMSYLRLAGPVIVRAGGRTGGGPDRASGGRTVSRWGFVLLAVLLLAAALPGPAGAQERRPPPPGPPQRPVPLSGPPVSAARYPLDLFPGGEQPPAYPVAAGSDLLVWSAVVAAGEGQPADGLGRQDLRILEGGKAVEPAFFAARPAPAGETPAGEAGASVPAGETPAGEAGASVPSGETPAAEAGSPVPAAAAGFSPRGWYVAVFDLTVSDPLELRRGADLLLEQAGQALGPDDRLAVLFFDGQLTVASPFTADLGALRQALDGLPGRAVYDVNDFFGGRVKVTARGDEHKMTSEIDRSDDQAEHNFAARRFFDELRRLAGVLSAVAGRKQLLVFSGGYNRKFLTIEEVAYLRMVDALGRATVSAYAVHTTSKAYADRLVTESGMTRKRLERAGAGELKQAAKLLEELALSTGGLYRASAAEGKELLAAAFGDGAHHYLLGFRRRPPAHSGDFIIVEVEAGGRGRAVRAPLGYYDD